MKWIAAVKVTHGLIILLLLGNLCVIAQDADWYKEMSTDVPFSITDNIYTLGKLGIGVGAVVSPAKLLHLRALGDILIGGGAPTSTTMRMEFLQPDFMGGFITNSYDISVNTNSLTFANPTSTSTNIIMTLKNEGHVGIGTNLPDRRLHISHAVPNGLAGIKIRNAAAGHKGWTIAHRQSGSVGLGGSLHFYNEEHNKTSMMIDEFGKVVIGTTDAIGSLTVHGESGTSIDLVSKENPTAWENQIRFNDKDAGLRHIIFDDYSDNTLHIYPGYGGGADRKVKINGSLLVKEVEVKIGWSDFVFEQDYRLMPLNEVEQFIARNGHLPDIPSGKEVEENGLQLASMQTKMMQKIEELTLYVIELKKDCKIKLRVIIISFAADNVFNVLKYIAFRCWQGYLAKAYIIF